MRRAAAIRQRMSFSRSVSACSLMSELLRIGLHLGRDGVAEEAGRVLPGQLADVAGGEVADLVAQDRLRVGPRAVLVGVVGLEEDVVDTDAVPLVEAARVVDRAE